MYYHNYSKEVTLKFKSKNLNITFTLKRNKEIRNVFLFKEDLVFNDSVNKSARLFITDRRHITTEIPTIPIDHIIIDDSNEIIICLSRAEVSPYNIVLYNFKGELLFKKKILPLEIVLDSVNFNHFRDSFSAFYDYAYRNKQILHINGLYYIDLAYWHNLSKYQTEKIMELDWMEPLHYFPNLFSENFDGTPPYELSKYTNFYSQTDPFYDYEYQNGMIKCIILNDEYGGRVKIPIVFD